MSYKNFDRHAAYTPEIMNLIREAIRETEDFAIDNGKSMFNRVTNSLSGLYDGYLYDSLIQDAIDFGLNEVTIDKIKGIVKSTEMYILLNGQAMTQV